MSSVISDHRRSYQLDEGVALPPLTDLAARHASATRVVAGAAVVQHLEATYFDTVDRRLAEAKLTLREQWRSSKRSWASTRTAS